MFIQRELNKEKVLDKTNISNSFLKAEDSEKESFLYFIYECLLIGRREVEYCIKNQVFDNYNKNFRYYLLGYKEITVTIGSKQNKDNSIERYVVINADGNNKKIVFNELESNIEIILRFLIENI